MDEPFFSVDDPRFGVDAPRAGVNARFARVDGGVGARVDHCVDGRPSCVDDSGYLRGRLAWTTSMDDTVDDKRGRLRAEPHTRQPGGRVTVRSHVSRLTSVESRNCKVEE